MYSDLINFIESHPLDSSNNNGGWETREEIEFVVRRIETEIREGIQRWREEMERENRELRNEIMRIQIAQVEIRKGNVTLQREFFTTRIERNVFSFMLFYI